MDPVLLEVLCTTLIVTYATNPFVLLILPKGNCKTCCPYKSDDIKLYVNIPGEPYERYFDWENGSDWRQLDNNRKTVIYIHGFTESSTATAANTVRQAFRERATDNLILVDWSTLAAGPWYAHAVENTRRVARYLATVVDTLVIRGLPLENIHVVGFSLGAEIAGLMAKKLTVGKLKRITGLDPALPLYDALNPRGRLAKTDAEFVDVIHTDGGIFGFDTPIGHADFFPNGGRPAQPGCKAETLVNTGRINDFIACSHNRAWKYFAESVNDPYAFPAYKCASLYEFEKGKCPPGQSGAYMGYFVDKSLRGLYFLDTQPSEPFGLGRHQHLYPGYSEGIGPSYIYRTSHNYRQNTTKNQQQLKKGRQDVRLPMWNPPSTRPTASFPYDDIYESTVSGPEDRIVAYYLRYSNHGYPFDSVTSSTPLGYYEPSAFYTRRRSLLYPTSTYSMTVRTERKRR